jgi:hypothetical protein
MKFSELLGGVYATDLSAGIICTQSDKGWHITVKLYKQPFVFKESSALEVRSNYATEEDRDNAFQVEVIKVLRNAGLLNE